MEILIKKNDNNTFSVSIESSINSNIPGNKTLPINPNFCTTIPVPKRAVPD